MDILLLLWLFTVKHFLIDFVFQTTEEVEHKGTYLDYRGVKHSIKHAFGTLFVLLLVGASFDQCWTYAAADFLIHYHIDWVKMNMTRKLTVDDYAFWVWLGFDQTLHYLTYIIFIAIMIS